MQRYLEPRMDQQDTFNESVSTLLERKVRGWLSGVFDDMRRSSPVQQWLDSLPTDSATKEKPNEQLEETQSNEESTLEPKEDKEDDSINETDKFNEDSVPEDRTLEVPASRDLWKRKSLESAVLTSTPLQDKTKKLQRDYSVQSEGCAVTLRNPLFRDSSLQSDASGSSGSSVLNVLGARKVDAESVLLALGFGPSEKQQRLQRIPDRFLVPSKLKGISTEKFIQEEQHSMRMHDCGIFGYRGLTGNPHVQPSTIVAKIIECILAGDTSREAALQARHSVADIRSAALLARPRRDT